MERLLKIHSVAVLLVLVCFPGHSQEPAISREDTIRQSVIVANRHQEVSVHAVKPRRFKGVFPAGEPDVIKLIQTLPGVSTGMEGTSAFYVRGGNLGNNAISLDGTTLYGTSHLLGLTGIVPVDVIDDSRFQVGSFLAEDGNFTASHVNMQSRSGSMTRASGSFSVSTTMAGLSFSTPIVKEKASLLVSARYAPLAWEYNMIRPYFSEGIKAPDSLKTIVADVFGKLTVKTGKRGELQLSTFYSMDAYRFSLTEKTTDLIRWRNLVGQAVYSYRYSDRLFLQARASINSYASLQAIIRDEITPTTLQLLSGILEVHANVKGEYSLQAGRLFRGGFETRLSRFNPGAYKQTWQQGSDVKIDNIHPALIYSIFGEYESTGELMDFRLSFRGNLYHGERMTRFDPEFRGMLRYHLSPGLDLQATIDHLVQYYHTLEGIPTGWSLDVKTPSGKLSPPEKSTQVYGGICWNKGPLLLTTGLYYKDMRNLVYFMDAKQLFGTAVSSWETKIDVGKGKSFGWEMQADMHMDKWEASLAYTLSKTDRKFPLLNEGHSFPAKFDRRHILSFSSQFNLGKADRFEHGPSTLVSFSSGHYETLKSGTYPALVMGMPPSDELYDYLATRNYYSHPNNYHMPSYFRWDVAYYFQWHGQRVSHRLQAGIYNLTNRHNAATLYYDEEDATYKKLSIFPLMPSLNYVITF